MRVILIRHGQTEWNKKRRYCGFADVALNKVGIKQARILSQLLNKEKIDKAYSSDMKRTRQFGSIALKNIPVEELPELREINFGIFEGLTYEEAVNKYPKIYSKWIKAPLNFRIPRGESLNILAKRVIRAWKIILAKNNHKTIAIFSHAGPIKVILCDLLKRDLEKEFWQLNPASANINIIDINKRKSVIHLLNDTSYLSNE